MIQEKTMFYSEWIIRISQQLNNQIKKYFLFTFQSFLFGKAGEVLTTRLRRNVFTALLRQVRIISASQV